ncbi:hypothetical protein P171DRAFT_447360 [Karstenula rhodostoma CBS 690.94]|uniref:Uncharacterized protein n=1 Tax=Karstenula rhodostoma CBS 690.94 TaxID=1392251 RepID=A0A9P4U806_9PLEO|nr:hypothetical protein P171DRAFT_447360 [Karstenula rhodostoma CBS 690.94]
MPFNLNLSGQTAVPELRAQGASLPGSHAKSTGSQKHARDEASEPGDDDLENHVRKYQASYIPSTLYRAGGVGIGSNSTAAQGMWQLLTVPQPAHTGTMMPQLNSPNSIPSAQLGHAMGPAPALTMVFQSNKGVQGAIPLQPMTSKASSFKRFNRDLSSPRPRSRHSDRSRVPSYVDPPVAASAGLDQRATQRQRVPAAGSARPGYNQPPSSASGQQLGSNGGHPAHAGFGSNGRPPVQQQQYLSSNPIANQPYPQAPPNQASTPAQPRTYQPTPKEQDWYDMAAYQLANPFHNVPRIPINKGLPREGKLLLPYEVLLCRFLEPEERYRRYTNYSNILTALYGPTHKTPQQYADLQNQLMHISGWLRQQEKQELQLRYNRGDLKAFKQDRDRRFTLAELGLGPTDLPVTLSDPQAVGSRTECQSVPRPPATTQRNDIGTAPAIYMPNSNRVPYQAPAGSQHGSSSRTLPRGTTRQAFAPSHTGHSPQAIPTVDQYHERTYGVFSDHQPSSTGYQTPAAAFPHTLAAKQQQRSSFQGHQQRRTAPGNASSAPIVIYDDDQPAQVAAPYAQRSPGVNAAVKRRRSDEQGRSVKIARTASYTKAVDLTDDSDEAAVSRSLQTFSPTSNAPPPVHKTFESSENTKEFEEFKTRWQADKKKVQNTLPGQLLNISTELLARYNNGEFKHKTAWQAFNASRKNVWLAEERVKEREKKRKAQRAREREKKKANQVAAQAAARAAQQEEKRDAEQKARQEKRRLEREEAERKEAEEKAAQAQKEREERKAAAQEELVDLFVEGFEETNEESTVDEDSLFGDDEDSAEGNSTSPNDVPTGTTSSGDEADGDLDSLFGDDDDDNDTPITSPEENQMISSKTTIAKTSETVALEEPAIASSTELESAESEQSETELPTEEIPEEPTAEESDGEAEDGSHDQEEDPEIAAVNAQMRALDEEIAKKAAQLSNTTNNLFKKRGQAMIDGLLEKKRALGNEIARLCEERQMAQVEAEGGL